MIIFVWNFRGLGRSAAVRALRELIRSHRLWVIFLSETKILDSVKASRLGRTLGFPNSHVVLASSTFGGLLLLWSDVVSLKIVVDNFSLIHCPVENDGSSGRCSWFMTLVYGPPTLSNCSIFWDDLNRIGAIVTEPWLIVGDFNAVLEQKDKKGGRMVASSSYGGFKGMIDDNGLIDFGFIGHPFTWNNKRKGQYSREARSVFCK